MSVTISNRHSPLSFQDQSEHIKFEAFNVFKVFVANPDKSPAVLDILLRNQGRLIQYLEEFQSDSRKTPTHLKPRMTSSITPHCEPNIYPHHVYSNAMLPYFTVLLNQNMRLQRMNSLRKKNNTS